MPKQKPGQSKQDYRTPPEFIDAVKTLLEIDRFDIDIAADDDNAVADCYFSERHSAFEAPNWVGEGGWNWLNPPYNNIKHWVRRAHAEAYFDKVRTAVLIPASVGANWWRDYVHFKSEVLFLNGRITFQGCDAPYPKDCALLLYPPRECSSYYDVLTWAK